MGSLKAWGLTLAMSASFAFCPAEAEDSYGGPDTISFRSNGALVLTLDGSVDLVAGTADIFGPCPPGIRPGGSCGRFDQRHITLSHADLAKLRALASEVSVSGLFDGDCIKSQQIEKQIHAVRQKEEIEKKRSAWQKDHPDENIRNFLLPPTIPPLDPSYAALKIEGVGSVEWKTEAGDLKSNALCMTPATKAIWDIVLNPYAPTWRAN